MFLKLFLIINFIYVSLGQDADPIIKTPLGKIRGTIRKSYKGKPFQSFEGIPYAKPPVGALRFRHPEPIEPWEGIRETKTVYDCLQIDFHNDTASLGEEDCLYLNVYVPEKKCKSSETYNVIVNIHGGSFYFGSGHTFGNPGYIMDRNVILVTLNYRLGPFGFLSTGDANIPGNNGLKDQSLALKWIQSNIASFGGKSNSITLMGFSSGGASVHFHYFSLLSRGLFHRGLSQSETGIGPWAIDKSPVEKAKALAEALGCSTTNMVVLTKCLRQTPAKQLMDKFIILKKSANSSLAMYFPVVEKNAHGAFLTDLPLNMVKERKLYDVPWMVSNTADEGLTLVVEEENINYDLLNTQWNTIIAELVNIVDRDIKKCTDEIKEIYFGKGQAVTEKNFNKYIKLLTDALFIADCERTAKLQASFTQSPVYYYYFNYSGSISFTEYITPKREFPGVSHGDDIIHIFPHIIPSSPNSTDLKITEIFLDMLESYSKDSVPKIKNVEWRPIKDFRKLAYLQINSPVDIQMKTTYNLGNWKLWTEIGSCNKN